MILFNAVFLNQGVATHLCVASFFLMCRQIFAPQYFHIYFYKFYYPFTPKRSNEGRKSTEPPFEHFKCVAKTFTIKSVSPSKKRLRIKNYTWGHKKTLKSWGLAIPVLVWCITCVLLTHAIPQGCTTQTLWRAKFFLTHTRAKDDMF